MTREERGRDGLKGNKIDEGTREIRGAITRFKLARTVQTGNRQTRIIAGGGRAEKTNKVVHRTAYSGATSLRLREHRLGSLRDQGTQIEKIRP